MKYLVQFFVPALCLAFAACAPMSVAMPTTAPANTVPATARPAEIRIELPIDPDLADLPRAMAADALREKGYIVHAFEFDDNALSIQALVQGHLDFSHVPSSYSWTAIQKGAPIVTVLDTNSDSGVIVVGPEIQKCSDMDGKSIAVPGLTSNRTLLFYKYIEKNCPGTHVEPVIIQSQASQLMGVTAGQVEIAGVQGSTFRKLQMSGPTDLHVLVSFGKEFPGLGGSQFVTRRDLIEKHPEVVEDLIREVLLARRKLQDPEVFADALVKYLKMEPQEAETMARGFFDQNLWTLDGGLSRERIQANIDFLVESDVLEPGLAPADVVDLAPLNAVLDEIESQ